MGTEILSHFIMFMVLVVFSTRLWRCVMLGKTNFDGAWSSTDDKIHLLDHLLGAGLSIVGSTASAVLLFIEMVSHLLGYPAQLHVAINAALTVTLTGSAYLAWHLEKEESPSHPFYHWREKHHGESDPMFMRQYLK